MRGRPPAWLQLALLVGLLALTAPRAAATIWYVPEDHATIQAALDVCADGDIISVAAGTYVEGLRPYSGNGSSAGPNFGSLSNVTLLGAGPGKTVIDLAGSTYGLIFQHTASNNVVSGVTLTNAGSRAVTGFNNSVNNTIEWSVIEYGQAAVATYYSGYRFERCTFRGTGNLAQMSTPIVLHDSIVYGGQVDTNAVSATYSLFSGTSAVPAGVGNLSGDAGFEDLGAGYWLRHDSPARDAADPATPVPVGGGDRADIGALEFIDADGNLLDDRYDALPNDNQPPVAAAAGPYSAVACDGISAVVALDGSGSADPDGEIVAWTWRAGSATGPLLGTGETPTLSFDVGTTVAVLVVKDASGATASAPTAVHVQGDTTPPSLTCPDDLAVTAAAGACDATVTLPDVPTATDDCGVTGITHDGPEDGRFGAGVHLVTWTAGDSAGHTATCAQTVTVSLAADLPTVDASCDGVDDDCDGLTDEDYAGALVSCGTGACTAHGVARCVGGAVIDECTPLEPAASADDNCDGVDDDCDGDTDEDYVPSATACGVGACAATGVESCVDGALVDDCAPGAPLAQDDATCDGVDDDCDGVADEDYLVTAVSCGTGACVASGLRRCAGGQEVEDCTPLDPSAGADDNCDGVDDDCDGETDEEHAPVATSCGVGACAGTAGASTCVDGALIDSCDPLEGAGEEICNGADDNCDGLVDEDGEGGSVCGPLDTEATCPEAVVADTTLEVTPSNPLDASHEGFECLLDDGAWAPCAAGDTFELEHGSHLLHVRAVDGAGHADPTPVVCSFAVDTVPPDTIIELHPADPTRDPVALFGFASDEQPVSYRCALDPAMTPPPADAYTACAATTRFEGLGDGPHVLWVFAVDEAKNADPSPASYGWTVDGSAPETEITSPPVGAVLVGDAVSFEYASPGAPGHSTFQCRLLDQEALWTPCDTGVASWEDLAVGAYTFEVRACHAATGVCDGTPAREDFHVVDALCGVPFELTCEERLTVDAPAEACAWTGVASATATHDCLITVSVDVSSASYPVGVHAIRFAGDDGQGHGDACETALAVRDVTPPSVACGAWEPKLGRVRALGSDACGVSLSVELTACAPAGDPTADAPAETACPVSADGDSLVLDAEPSVAMEVTYTVHAVDPSGLDAQKTCSVTVAPTPGGADPAGSDSGCGSAPGGGSTTPWVLLAMLLVTGSIRRTRVSR